MNEIAYKNPRQRRYTSEEQKEILQRLHNSGMTKSKFCKKQGIAPSTLYQWLNQSADTVQSNTLPWSAVHRIDQKEITEKEDDEQTLVEVSLSTQAVMRFKLPIKNLLLWITELCHATTTLR